MPRVQTLQLQFVNMWQVAQGSIRYLSNHLAFCCLIGLLGCRLVFAWASLQTLLHCIAGCCNGVLRHLRHHNCSLSCRWGLVSFHRNVKAYKMASQFPFWRPIQQQAWQQQDCTVSSLILSHSGWCYMTCKACIICSSRLTCAGGRVNFQQVKL